jgi:queuine tRNA-ribosyltransferase
MDFDGFGIGGEFGYDKKTLEKVVAASTDELPENKPRHLLGIGHPEDFAYSMRAGSDTFDCIVPTQYARRATVFTSTGRIDLRKPSNLKIQKPLDPKCKCEVCKNYSRGYVAHLLRAHDLTGMKLATMHNIFFFNQLAATLRKKIGNGEL